MNEANATDHEIARMIVREIRSEANGCKARSRYMARMLRSKAR